MPNTYRPTSDRAKALYGDDDLDLDLSASDEADAFQGGHLALVPRPFKVLVNNYEAGEQGDVVDLALHVDQEAALVSAGILERVEPAKKSTKKSTATTTRSK
jgi:hypothetical protein